MQRTESAPGDLEVVPGDVTVEELQNRLRCEMELHQQTFEHMKELEKKLELATAGGAAARTSPVYQAQPVQARPSRSASAPKLKRFGITDTGPYVGSPPMPAKIPSPKRQAVCLPALRTLKPRGNPEHLAALEAEAAAAEAAEAALDPQLANGMSRAGRSRLRVQAIKQLDNLGMNTWHERRAEKVSRIQDLTVFSESMWGSFFSWSEDANAVT